MNEARRQDLLKTAYILRETFGVSHFEDEAYLRWFYDENPVGRALEEHFDEDGRRLAHLAGIPQEYHCRERRLSAVFPLHIAVDPSLRGRGMMSNLSRRCFEASRAWNGTVAFVGMPNDNSTPGYTGRLGFRLVRPLPARIGLPGAPSFGVRRYTVDSAFLESATFEEIAGEIDFEPGSAWSQRWTPERLRWRLGAPGASYGLHVGAAAIAVSAGIRQRGIPVAVLLKLYPRRERAPAGGAALVSSACLLHRAPLSIYAGWNDRVRLPGLVLPERFKPAPLNLIFRSLDAAVIDQDEMDFDTFEFLDFDAY